MVKNRRRRSNYNSKFVGFTQTAFRNFQRDIPNCEVRTKAVWLLLTMLIVGEWDYYSPSEPFKCSQRTLRGELGWAFSTIRKYRQVLIDTKTLSIHYPGGLYGKAHLYKLNTKYMGMNG